MLISHSHSLTHKIKITELERALSNQECDLPLKRKKETQTDLELVYNKQGGED